VTVQVVALLALQVAWHDLAKFPVEGKGWTDTKHPYDRLPARAEPVVRAPVWSLSQDSAGLRYRFVTDATSIRARWKVRKPTRLAMPHMPATGVSGIDLYVNHAGEWRWMGAGRPDKELNEGALASGLPKAVREFALYLPLYNGIDSVEIGLNEGASLRPAPDRYAGRKPIVFYGTSILQGGCASRPGMAYTSIVGRMLDWPTINLGFSGNGKTEPEMARFLAELDPSLYVMDSLPNLDTAEVNARLPVFLDTLRAKHPTTPILLVENVTYSNSAVVDAQRERVSAKNGALRAIYESRVKVGDKHLFYVPTFDLLGGDGEDTVDGVHPTDLGFLRMAQGIVPHIRNALGR
jgi:hypothetical protein